MTKIKITNRKLTRGTLPRGQANDPGAGGGGDARYALNVANNNNNSYTGSNLHYRPLSSRARTAGGSSNDEYIDSQFQKPPARVPTRSICLATFLCFAGSSLLIFGLLVFTGHLDAKVENYADRVWPMIIMGFLMFIPGAYHVRIAYYAYKGIPGYSFDDIPEFE